MKVVLDTNVFISGVFFSGPPYEILSEWHHGRLEIVLSPEILAEYQDTIQELAHKFRDVDGSHWIELAATEATMIAAPPLSKQICADQDDDKFLACALAGRIKFIISGDKALLATSGFKGIAVLTPRQFVDRHIRGAGQ